LEVLILLALIGTPVSVGLAWWLWCRRSLPFPTATWRKRLQFSGLLAASCNLLLYGGYLIYWSKFMYVPDFWKVRDACGTIGWCLAIWGLIAAILGKGPSSAFIAIACLLGFLLWIPVAVL